jgi:hypothetical protein
MNPDTNDRTTAGSENVDRIVYAWSSTLCQMLNGK